MQNTEEVLACKLIPPTSIISIIFLILINNFLNTKDLVEYFILKLLSLIRPITFIYIIFYFIVALISPLK